jgi:hypothetical protein
MVNRPGVLIYDADDVMDAGCGGEEHALAIPPPIQHERDAQQGLQPGAIASFPW